MMTRRSIRSRLTLWYTAVLVAGLVIFSLTIWFGLRELLRSDLRRTLAGQSQGFDEYLRIEDRDQPIRLPHEIDEYSRSMPDNFLLLVTDAAGKELYRSESSPPAWRFTRHSSSPRGPIGHMHWKNAQYLVMSRPLTLREGSFTAFLAISAESTDRAIRLLGVLLLALVPVFVVGGAAGGYWLSRRALSPVDRITEEARSIRVENLSSRLEVPPTGDEIARLAETWNETLARLETAVQKISQFTADASHELRTPVAIVRLAAENALRKSRTEAEYRETLTRIQQQSENMTALIENLLFLARADLAESLAECEPVELPAIIREVCVEFKRLAAEREIHLASHVPPGARAVMASPAGVRQMLTILLDNALKYTPAGGSVTVRLDESGSEARLSVIDTGIGIPEHARGHVFERFFRADPSRNKESGGFGLGLSIAHSLAQQQNGSIELSPAPSGGCEFSITLPVVS